jgi:3-deoxy-D-manno-octulosonic-acid transferase
MPYYAYRMIKRGGYKKDFKYRFGLFKKLPKRKFGKKRLWIQAVSVGEVKALEKLINLLVGSDLYEIVLTTTTSTGYELAHRMYANKILFVGLFPFDFWLFSWLAWKRIFPHLAILMESEIWPEHVWQAHLRDVPVILINARISDKTLARYKTFPNLAKSTLDNISYVLASDQLMADRCHEIGITWDRIKIAGNMKFDNRIPKLDPMKSSSLRNALGFTKNDLILLGSSTWPEEEAMLIRALKKCRNDNRRWKLLLVPRHAERRNQIFDLLKTSGFKWHQRSKGKASAEVDICFADTTGELQTLTSIADLAFIGKSLAPNSGGQSPVDAACHGVPIVYGDQMTNFKGICLSLEHSKCVVKVKDSARAIMAITILAKDESKRQGFAQKLQEWHRNNCGASEFIAKKIQDIAFANR